MQLLSWPSGLRRSTQVRVRPAGVGSNPTGTTILAARCGARAVPHPSPPKNAFDRGRTGDLGIMRPTRCQLRHESKTMRHPGIEPGAPRWQRGILPLNQWRFVLVSSCHFTLTTRQRISSSKNGVRSGIRTHAPEETGALNQRLRPLGHPNTFTYALWTNPTCVENSIAQKVVLMGLEPMTLGLLDQCSTI